MNWKHFFAMILLGVVFLTVVSCAKEVAETDEETEIIGETTEAAEEYSPEVVDNLTQDFEEMDW